MTNTLDMLDKMEAKLPYAGFRATARLISRDWVLLSSRYIRYTRWKPTSRAEAVAAEQKLLGFCR